MYDDNDTTIFIVTVTFKFIIHNPIICNFFVKKFYFRLINDCQSIYNFSIVKQSFKTKGLKIDLHSYSFRWERGSTFCDLLVVWPINLLILFSLQRN